MTLLTAGGALYLRPGITTVQLSATVRDAILGHARDACWLESGGGLYTDRPVHEVRVDVLRIDAAHGPGRSFRQRRDEIVFDPKEVDDAREGLLGFWHSHPRGGARLSTPDLDCFTRVRSAANRPPLAFVALLATPGPEVDTRVAWRSSPQLHAWVLGDGWYRHGRVEIVPDPPKPKPRRAASTRPGRPGMVVATRTFVATYDGRREQIIAGRDRILADHPIVREYPDYFTKETA